MKVSSNCVLIPVSALLFVWRVKCLTSRPIIGIIAREASGDGQLFGNTSITASYVKFLETGGARVVPIMVYKSQDYYEDLMRKINGVLFPGGGDLVASSGYGRTAKIIFDIAIRMNDNGDFFPLWGTCLGFEVLNYVAANRKNWMVACSADDLAANLNFVHNLNNSRMYKHADKKLIDTMATENVTVNYHHWCITPQLSADRMLDNFGLNHQTHKTENYTLSGLDKIFKVLSLNRDAKNLTFISSIEAHSYPFYGVVFHPEIVLFEWQTATQRNIPHTNNATRVAQYFANFFVDEARRNSHRFSSKAAEDAVLIYNYQATFTGKLNMDSDQMFFFS